MIGAIRKEIARVFLSPHCQMSEKRHNKRMYDPPSPCVSVCRVDPEKGWCTGCRRTLEEIVDWPMLTPRERREIVARIDLRD